MRTRLSVMFVAVLFFVAGLFLYSADAYQGCQMYGKDHGCQMYGKDQGGLDSKIFAKAHFFLKNEAELGLSEEQVKEIKALKVAAKKELIQRNADIDEIEVDVKAKMYDDVLDVNTINALIDSKYELKKAKAKYVVETYAALKNILTVEQKAALKELWGKCDKR